MTPDELHQMHRWFSAYNAFIASRVDLLERAAALVQARPCKPSNGGTEASG